MGHGSINNGRHAEMGSGGVATGPAKHGILLIPKHAGPGGRACKRPSECRWTGAKAEAIPTLADVNPYRMVLTFNSLKLVPPSLYKIFTHLFIIRAIVDIAVYS